LKNVIAFILAFTLFTALCFSNPQGADPAEGFWLFFDERTGLAVTGWQVYQEGGKLHGKMLSTTIAHAENNARDSYPNFPIPGRVSEMPLLGTPWVFGLTMQRPGVWSGGNIIHPRDGRMFRCRITFHPADGRRFMVDTLELRGEIGLRIGRSQFLQRTDQETASSLQP
jgi:uncharacterized protein (DUF2147 family)